MLPDGDAASAVAAIRADKRLAHIPLVMVTASGAPAGDRADAQAVGFADIVELPAPPGALGLLVGRLLGVPLREDDRFAVRVHVFDGSGSESPETYVGTSVDLSENGMLLRAKKSAPAGSVLGMRFALPGRTGELSLRGRVVRADDKAFAPQHALALAFENVTAADRAALHEYLRVLTGDRPFSWRTIEGVGEYGGRTIVELYGVLRGESDVTALARLKGDVWLKLREFRRISSDSVQKWIDIVRAMPADRLHLIECPIPFIHQANLITNLLERQEVESFFAPYSCAACGLDEEKLVDVKGDLDGGKRRVPPAHKCSSCGAALAFDELVEQYFAFLDR